MKQHTQVNVCLFAVLLACVAGSSCLPKTKPTTIVTLSGEIIETRQVRVWVYELTNRLAGQIELAANEIIETAEDPNVRSAALKWKASVVPALQRASFQPDPLVAWADLWLFVIQLEDLMQTEYGRKTAGDLRMSVVETLKDMEDEILEFAREKGGAPIESGMYDLVHSHAAEHPIEASITTRPTIAAAVTDRLRTGNVGAFSAMGSLVEGFADLSDRLSIYAEQLPKQARWQAEILLWDAGLESGDINALLADVTRLGRVADRLVEFSDELPVMIDGHVEELMPRIKELIESIDLETFETSVDKIVTVQLAIALDAVTREREEAIDILLKERLVAFDDAEQMANEVVDRSFERVEAIIDASLNRLIPLGAAVMVGPFALGLLAGWVLRRRSGLQTQEVKR
jgi:hypothetical protein